MGYSKYADGKKWCSSCMKFVNGTGVYCPICQTRLRNGPKAARLKKEKPRIS